MTRERQDLRPAALDLDVLEGSSWSVEATLHFDLTSAEVTARIRYDSGDLVDLDLTVVTPTTGVVSFGQDTASKSGNYDVRVTMAGGLPRTYLIGYVGVERSLR